MMYYKIIKREDSSREKETAKMEHFELVEKLVNTFGVSYEKAKEALEASNWDAIDAAIYLEKEKNGTPKAEPEVKDEPVQQEPAPETVKEEPAKEEPVQEEAQAKVNTEPKGSAYSSRPAGPDWRKECSKFFKTIWDFLSLNSFVVKKNSGEVFLDIPIWLMTLLLCAFFWAVIFVLGIVFIMGYRFSFSGPQLGKKNIKNTVNKVESVTEDIVEKVKSTVSPDNVEPVENTETTAASEQVQTEIKLEELRNEKAASEENSSDSEEEDVKPSEPTE